MANLATRRCTTPASPATSLPKTATTFSRITHLRPELKRVSIRFFGRRKVGGGRQHRAKPATAGGIVNIPTYSKEITALLVVDPYNDFISEGGKIWPRIRAVAEANN